MLHWLLCGTLTTQLKPIQPQNNMKKWLEVAALELLLGLTRPGPCEPELWKNDLPANIFLLHLLPQSVINLHRLFIMSNTNTHYDMFLKNLRYVWVLYISWYVLGSKSLTSLPIFTQQRARGEENTMIYRKMRPFEWNHIPALFYDSVVWFFLPKCVCVLPMVFVMFSIRTSFFHQNIMFLCFL